MKRLICLLLILLSVYKSFAQQPVIDVAAVAAIVSTHAAQNENLNKIRKEETKITILQAKIALRQEQIRALQVKVYNARKSAMSWVTTVRGITKSYNYATDIVAYQDKIFELAGTDVKLNIIALGLQLEAADRAATLLEDILNALLGGEIAGKPINLMDSKQRLDLIYRVNKELIRLRGIVYGVYRKVRKIKRVGLVQTVLKQGTQGSLWNDASTVFTTANGLFF